MTVATSFYSSNNSNSNNKSRVEDGEISPHLNQSPSQRQFWNRGESRYEYNRNNNHSSSNSTRYNQGRVSSSVTRKRPLHSNHESIALQQQRMEPPRQRWKHSNHPNNHNNRSNANNNQFFEQRRDNRSEGNNKNYVRNNNNNKAKNNNYGRYDSRSNEGSSAGSYIHNSRENNWHGGRKSSNNFAQPSSSNDDDSNNTNNNGWRPKGQRRPSDNRSFKTNHPSPEQQHRGSEPIRQFRQQQTPHQDAQNAIRNRNATNQQQSHSIGYNKNHKNHRDAQLSPEKYLAPEKHGESKPKNESRRWQQVQQQQHQKGQYDVSLFRGQDSSQKGNIQSQWQSPQGKQDGDRERRSVSQQQQQQQQQQPLSSESARSKGLKWEPTARPNNSLAKDSESVPYRPKTPFKKRWVPASAVQSSGTSAKLLTPRKPAQVSHVATSTKNPFLGNSTLPKAISTASAKDIIVKDLLKEQRKDSTIVPKPLGRMSVSKASVHREIQEQPTKTKIESNVGESATLCQSVKPTSGYGMSGAPKKDFSNASQVQYQKIPCESSIESSVKTFANKSVSKDLSCAYKPSFVTKRVDVAATPDLTEPSTEDFHSDRDSRPFEICIPQLLESKNAIGIVSESPHSLLRVDEGGGVVKEHVKEQTLSDSIVDVELASSKKAAATPPEAIQQPAKQHLANAEHVPPENKDGQKEPRHEWDSVNSSDSDSDDSSTSSEEDEQEILRWAQKMFGVTPPGLIQPQEENQNAGDASPHNRRIHFNLSEMQQDEDLVSSDSEHFSSESLSSSDDDSVSSLSDHIAPPARPLKLKTKTKLPTKKKRTLSSAEPPNKKAFSARNNVFKKKGNRKPKVGESLKTEEQQRKEKEESRRLKKEAKLLTAAEIKAILGDDEFAQPSSEWVRRSVRQPSRSAINAPNVRSLTGKLRDNDADMVVLKLKKYVSDPDTPQVVIDAVLDALEENTNCQALYIQNFNLGMRDEQVLHLIKVLQQPSCSIWCLNIGETYNVKRKTWKAFAKGLKKTKVTHMYASEHTISADLKDSIRETIRRNRKKHDMHINPKNLDVIIQCTHCWWNPVNAKVLRPYLQKQGFEYILHDKESQGLQGSSSGAPTGLEKLNDS